MSLLKLETVYSAISQHLLTIPKTRISLSDAGCRILAQDIVAPISLPPFRGANLDGYALRLQDIQASNEYFVESFLASGSGKLGFVPPKKILELATGACVPDEFDALIPYESCLRQGDKVSFQAIPRRGENIRAVGSDIQKGSLISLPGKRIDSLLLACCTALGIDELEVYSQPRLLLVTTGDEIVAPGQPLSPGQIYNANQSLLIGLLKGWNCEVSLVHLKDDFLETQDCLQQASREFDCIVTVGATSVGRRDFVRQVLHTKAALKAWKLAIKPGKPFAFSKLNKTPIFSLPGNPLSALVTALFLLRPYLQESHNMPHKPSPHQGLADFSLGAEMERDSFLFGDSNIQQGLVKLRHKPGQISYKLQYAAQANVCILVPKGRSVKKGDVLDFYFLRDLWSL